MVWPGCKYTQSSSRVINHRVLFSPKRDTGLRKSCLMDEGRAREALAIGRGPPGCPAPLLVRGPRRVQRAPRGCFLDPQAAGVEEVKASVNRRRLCLPAPQGCSFSPTPYALPFLGQVGFTKSVCLELLQSEPGSLFFFPAALGRLCLQVFKKKN